MVDKKTLSERGSDLDIVGILNKENEMDIEFLKSRNSKVDTISTELTHQLTLDKKLLTSSPPQEEEYPKGEEVNIQSHHEYPKGEEVNIQSHHEYPKGEEVRNRNNLPHLKTFRKALRNNLTPAEAKLWTLLKGKQVEGKKFRRQFSVANYILDFYCPTEHLAIELDGQGHFEATQAEYDLERDLFLQHCGIKVLRFENKWVWNNVEGVLHIVKENFGWRNNNPSVLRTAPLKGEQLIKTQTCSLKGEQLIKTQTCSLKGEQFIKTQTCSLKGEQFETGQELWTKIKTALIKDKALSLGFSACGMAKAEPLEEEIISRYQRWLKKGYHHPMSYMENHQEKRFNPLLLEPGTTSIISVLLSYAPHQELPTSYQIARYAWGKDYHLVVKEKLKALADFIHASYPSAHLRIFTDSAPVMERSWAVKAGLGWIGKNGLLLTKTWGSYVVIGEIFCDIPLTYDTPLTDASCGSCTRCIEACPTQAIVSPSVINAQRCIAGLTIEEKGELPLWLSPYIGKRIYGCDTCQEVCPWNKHCTLSTTPEFRPCVDMQQMNDQDWAQLTPERFSSLFRESAIKRITYPRLKRNIDFIPHAECNSK